MGYKAFALPAVLIVSAVPAATTSMQTANTASLPPIVAIRAYADPFFAFRMAVPEGWLKIETLETSDDEGYGESAYAVGFESPLSGSGDRFADFVMVELLPAGESGAFDSDGTHRLLITIDGRHAVRDRLLLEQYPVGDIAVELLVHQAIVSGHAYELGIYAIGEPQEAPVLAQAFELLIRTFELDEEPFPAF